MSTQITVAGWFISAVLDALTDKAISAVFEQIWLCQGFNYADLLRLQDGLAKARAVLNSAQANKLVLDQNLLQLLALLRSAILDAEDFLDDLDYQHLAKKLEESDSFLSTLNALWKRIFGWKVMELRRILMKLECFTPDHELFRLPVRNQNEVPETSSFPTTQMFGRVEERDRVVQHLVNPDNEEGPMSVVAIIGPPGIGKTSLAQDIFHDSRVKDHFHPRIWVHTTNFDLLKITQQIVEAMSEELRSTMPEELRSNLTNLDRLHTILEKLQTMRYLLVLDDMWNENERKWETLIAPLTKGSKGSMILGTTRSQMGADTMGAAFSICLDGLPDEIYFPFFMRRAFGSQNSADFAFGSQNSVDFPILEIVGKKIAGRLRGSPSAARTVAKYLKTRLEANHWIDTLKTELCELPQGEDGIFPVSASSYWYLPAYLKPCVSFSALFPEDHRFDKESLVQMWKANGFIIPEGTKPKEDVGNRYFDELIHRSIFQKHHDHYIMDPLLHDVVQSISKDEFLSIKEYARLPISSTVRHISVQAPKIELSQFIHLCKDKRLRSLLFFGNFDLDHGSAFGELENEVRTVRVLDLGCCNVTLVPENFGYMNQLRYFDAHGTRIETLPKSFGRLYNLHVLKVPSNPVVHLPEEVSKLINSRGCKFQAI